MMDRRHVEDSSPGGLEEGDLEDHRQRLDNKKPTEDEQQQLGPADDRHTREGPAERQ